MASWLEKSDYVHCYSCTLSFEIEEKRDNQVYVYVYQLVERVSNILYDSTLSYRNSLSETSGFSLLANRLLVESLSFSQGVECHDMDMNV